MSSTTNYSWALRGTLNGDFLSASGTSAGVDGVVDVTGTVGDGAPLDHSAWIWGGFSHFGLGYMKDGDIPNPCETHPHHVTRHWRGEDGAHIWSSNQVSGAEGAWSGDIKCIGDRFQPKGPIMQGKVRGQYPSHWIATARSDKEVDVHGVVTLKLRGGGTYTAHVHEYIQFWEPCVKIDRHYWKLDVLDGEYFPTHWWHKESAVVDCNWNWGDNNKEKDMDRINFTWHLFGKLNNRCIEADGFGFGSGYRQHQWGNGGKGFGEHGLPNLAWALAWEGHAGIHFFTRYPKGVVNPFIYSLPEGFVVNRKWYGQNGDHWTTTHDVRYTDGVINKRICLVGSGFEKDSLMMWKGDKAKGNWIVKSFPQYAVAVPKGDDHIWYRSTFQFLLNNGLYYSGYWEMDIHFRKRIVMPEPYVVKFWDETWNSGERSWHFYEREEVEQSTYDAISDVPKINRKDLTDLCAKRDDDEITKSRFHVQSTKEIVVGAKSADVAAKVDLPDVSLDLIDGDVLRTSTTTKTMDELAASKEIQAKKLPKVQSTKKIVGGGKSPDVAARVDLSNVSSDLIDGDVLRTSTTTKTMDELVASKATQARKLPKVQSTKKIVVGKKSADVAARVDLPDVSSDLIDGDVLQTSTKMVDELAASKSTQARKLPKVGKKVRVVLPGTSDLATIVPTTVHDASTTTISTTATTTTTTILADDVGSNAIVDVVATEDTVDAVTSGTGQKITSDDLSSSQEASLLSLRPDCQIEEIKSESANLETEYADLRNESANLVEGIIENQSADFENESADSKNELADLTVQSADSTCQSVDLVNESADLRDESATLEESSGGKVSFAISTTEQDFQSIPEEKRGEEKSTSSSTAENAMSVGGGVDDLSSSEAAVATTAVAAAVDETNNSTTGEASSRENVDDEKAEGEIDDPEFAKIMATAKKMEERTKLRGTKSGGDDAFFNKLATKISTKPPPRFLSKKK